MEFPFELILFTFLVTIAAVIQAQRDLFAAAMLTGIFSLLSAGVFTLMDAVDVAFTEAAVGAGISTVLMLATLARTQGQEKPHKRLKLVPLLAVTLTGVALLVAVMDTPVYGDPSAVIHQHVAPYYLNQSWEDIGLPNVVTSVLASYRGFDTFGELTVTFTAAVGVTLLLARRPEDETKREGADELPPPSDQLKQPVRMMPVVRTVTKLMIPIVALFALYVQAHGDFGPGGGFQAGVIFATSLILFSMIYGPRELERVAPSRVVEIGTVLGVLLYGGVGVYSLLTGYNFLDYGALSPHHPQHGQHWGIFLVELGVGLTVATVMLTIYIRFVARGSET